MPSRLTCLVILLYWSVAAVGLFTREILPDLFIGEPPDLRTVAQGPADPRPVRWSILVADDGATMSNLRAVGQATTQTLHTADGWTRLVSDAWVDAAEVLKGTPLAARGGAAEDDGIRLAVAGSFEIDPSGNLRAFRAGVRTADDPEELLTIDGSVKDGKMEIRTRSPLLPQMPLLNRARTFDYEPRGLVQNQLGPIEMLPGLQVGQRWRTRVVSPLTGRVEEVTAEVAGKRVIHWGLAPVTVLEVVHHTAPFTARTWVRPDGLVLRQEVPFPLVRLVVERMPEGP